MTDYRCVVCDAPLFKGVWWCSDAHHAQWQRQVHSIPAPAPPAPSGHTAGCGVSQAWWQMRPPGRPAGQ